MTAAQPWLRWGDLWVIVVVLVLALGAFALRTGGDDRAHSVTVVASGETRTLPLSQATTFALAGEDGMTVTVAIQDGAVRFAESDCPDRVCVHSGWLSRPGAAAACVPAGVTLQVNAADDEKTEVDAVAR